MRVWGEGVRVQLVMLIGEDVGVRMGRERM